MDFIHLPCYVHQTFAIVLGIYFRSSQFYISFYTNIVQFNSIQRNTYTRSYYMPVRCLLVKDDRDPKEQRRDYFNFLFLFFRLCFFFVFLYYILDIHIKVLEWFSFYISRSMEHTSYRCIRTNVHLITTHVIIVIIVLLYTVSLNTNT